MLKLLLCLTILVVKCESANILGVFPTPSISHQVVFRSLMIELAKRGHDVTVITTDPAFPKGQTPKNLTEIDVHDISYDYLKKIFGEHETHKKADDRLLNIKIMQELYLTILERQLKSPDVQNLLNSNKKFDLLFIESLARPALIYSYLYSAPVIQICSYSGIFPTFDNVGAATHPLYYPEVMHRRIYNLTFWEKMTNLYVYYSSISIYKQSLHKENKKLKEMFGPNVPDLDDLKRNVHMVFSNVHPIWDFNRPVPPNLVYLGGLHQKPYQELPTDMKTYLDSSENGVIYLSFGTNVKPMMLSPEKLKIFTNVFSKLSYDVLWKWDDDELPGRPKNVRISKWFPQSDLLRHPKIKLFITQGGLQSTDEAITAGVPLVGVPIHGDHWFNVEHYVKFNIGKQVSMETLTEDQLMEAIKSVILDESYRQNIVKLRSIIYDQPQSPLERAVWWTEHVLRHGGTHLRAPAAHVTWAEYYELELVLVLLAALVLLLAVSVLIVYFVFSKIRSYMRPKVKVN